MYLISAIKHENVAILDLVMQRLYCSAYIPLPSGSILICCFLFHSQHFLTYMLKQF